MGLFDKERTNISWKNYTKPTPRNLLAIAASMRRIVAVIIGTSMIMEANKWIPIGVLILATLLDEAKNFFATVVEDQKMESTTVEMPSGKEITISTPTEKPPTP